ncbi:MAG: hypothetical protein ACRDD9_02955, partial [Shewanella sp.]
DELTDKLQPILKQLIEHDYPQEVATLAFEVFVDLPDEAIRQAIFLIHCQRRGIDVTRLDLAQLSRHSQGFSGAEIEQAVIAAMYSARSLARSLDQDMLLEELTKTKPLSIVMGDKINALRQWAAGRTVNAHE